MGEKKKAFIQAFISAVRDKLYKSWFAPKKTIRKTKEKQNLLHNEM